MIDCCCILSRKIHRDSLPFGTALRALDFPAPRATIPGFSGHPKNSFGIKLESELHDMYAIIEEGGRQYKVTSGDTIQIDRQLEGDEKSVTFDRVLLVAGEGQPKIGSPLVSGATVTADVLGAAKGPKVRTVKYRRRKGYRRTVGHRQPVLNVKVTGINV